MSGPPPRSLVHGRRIAAVLLVVSVVVGAVVVTVLLAWLVPLLLEALP